MGGGENRYMRQYKMYCGRIFMKLRKEKNVSREIIASGLVSRQRLQEMENGVVGWPKVVGDILFHRLGISAEYYESIASAEDMDRWRQREDICLCMIEESKKVKRKIEEYRQNYPKREKIEEQFLQKAELILQLMELEKSGCHMNISKKESLLRQAGKVADYTIRDNWRQDLVSLWLSPAELEAILLFAETCLICGQIEEGHRIWQNIWLYPKMNHWEKNMQLLIIPQAALVGMQILESKCDQERSFCIGREAIELLRSLGSHRYLLDVINRLADLSPTGEEEEKYLEQVIGYRESFNALYQEFQCPMRRIWQTISLKNTHEQGLMLKMLRICNKKTQENAIYDEGEVIMETRNLSRIENGKNNPSIKNYGRLVKQYGKLDALGVPVLDTLSADVLFMRQEIEYMMEKEEWEQAEETIKIIRELVDESLPRNKQEILFLETACKQHTEDMSIKECLKIYLEALQCTIPDIHISRLQWWVFQREEVIIVCSIAAMYNRMGLFREAERWHQILRHSLELQMKRTGIPCRWYGILIYTYAETRMMKEEYDGAIEIGNEGIQVLLKASDVRYIYELLRQSVLCECKRMGKEEGNEKSYDEKWHEHVSMCKSLKGFLNKNE